MSFAFAEEAAAEVSGAVAEGRLDLRGFQNVGTSGLDALLGYLVVFIGLSLLMTVIVIVGKVMVAQNKKASAKTEEVKPAETAAVSVPEAPKTLAPGSAGEVKIYDTDPRDAAMIMAIVADKLGKPLNELRFRSIKEVK